MRGQVLNDSSKLFLPKENTVLFKKSRSAARTRSAYSAVYWSGNASQGGSPHAPMRSMLENNFMERSMQIVMEGCMQEKQRWQRVYEHKERLRSLDEQHERQ